MVGVRGGTMQPMAKLTPKALDQLRQDLSEENVTGKAVRLVFEGFG